MKKNKLILSVLTLIIFVFLSLPTKAQDEMSSNDAPVQNNNQKPRPNLLAELGLSRDQIQQIRRINQESRLKRQEAQQRVREAQKFLDEAIYADSADEAELQIRLKNLQLAQAEIIKLRILTEFAVRKILTPEQLVKFREVRQSFMRAAENRFAQPKNRPFNNPNKPLKNRQRRLRPNN